MRNLLKDKYFFQNINSFILYLCCYFLIMTSCSSQKQIFSLENKCFNINLNSDNIELFISRKEINNILKNNKKFKGYKIIFIAFDKESRTYLVEFYDKKSAYYCLEFDNEFKIIKEEKNLLDI